jgi:hypothetical protein
MEYGRLLTGGIFLLLFSSATLAVDCPPGYVWNRMSGPGCIQADCNSIPHAHYSYTMDCICGTDDCIGDPVCVECYEPVDYTSFDKNKCGIFCPGLRLYLCVKAGEKCPDKKASTTTLPAQTASNRPVMPSITVITYPTTTTAPKNEDCGAICRGIYATAVAVDPKAGKGMFISPGCACSCPEGFMWSFLNEYGRIMDPNNCPMMRPGVQYSAEELRKLGCGEPTFSCKPATGAIAAENDLWNRTLYECNHNTAPSLSAEGFLLYLRKVEEANPGKTWKQIIAKLHAEAYKEDVRRTLSLEDPIWGTTLIEIDLFKDGPDTDGSDQVKILCIVPPKFVTPQGGEKIDIAHTYAGLRSDLNRENHWLTQYTLGGWSWLVRHANTDLGDYFQVATSWGDWSYAPPDQLKGDKAGIWLANYYQDKRHENTRLSEAYAEYFASAGN